MELSDIMTPQQIKYVRWLLHRCGLMEEKDDIVYELTGGRTTHLTEMSQEETRQLIKTLHGETPRDRMVKKVLSMAHEMGWELPDGKVDMGRINAWCSKYTSVKKPLNTMEHKELPSVVTAFEKVYVSFLKGI